MWSSGRAHDHSGRIPTTVSASALLIGDGAPQAAADLVEAIVARIAP
jgi:hypothetical protein